MERSQVCVCFHQITITSCPGTLLNFMPSSEFHVPDWTFVTLLPFLYSLPKTLTHTESKSSSNHFNFVYWLIFTMWIVIITMHRPVTYLLTWPVFTQLYLFLLWRHGMCWVVTDMFQPYRLKMFLNAESLHSPAGQDVPNIAETFP